MARAQRSTTNNRREPKSRDNLPARQQDNVYTAFAGRAGSAGAVIFAKFNGNNGDFTYGTNPAKELEPGTEILVDMSQAVRHGWICWKESQVVDETMVPITEGSPPSEHDLPDHGPYAKEGDGWKQQVSLRFRLPDTGEELELKMTSRAGIRGVGGLCKEYGAQFRDHGPEDLILVALDSKSYTPKDKSYGRKYAPVFEIVEFIDPDKAGEMLGLAAPDDEDEDAEDQAQLADDSSEEDEGKIPVDDDEEEQDDDPPAKQEAPSASSRRPSRGRRAKKV